MLYHMSLVMLLVTMSAVGIGKNELVQLTQNPLMGLRPLVPSSPLSRLYPMPMIFA